MFALYKYLFACRHLETNSERILQLFRVRLFPIFREDIKDTFLEFWTMQKPFWLLTISNTDFLGVFSLFSIYTSIDLCRLHIICYGAISYGCNIVSWSLLLLFLNVLYLGLLMLKQCICKLCPEIDIERVGGIIFY